MTKEMCVDSALKKPGQQLGLFSDFQVNNDPGIRCIR